ncbi:MAG: hypothetical protein AAB538_05040 [Patescibacteria group bacterium]
MDQAAWQHLEKRFFLVVIIILVVFLLSAIGENRVQRADPNYQPIGRGY